MYSVFEQLLQKRGISTYRVAKDLGIAQSVFSAWKNGTSSPKTNKLQKIADYFGVTMDYLTGVSENGQPEGYYLNEENAKVAQEMFEDPDLRSLFHMKQNMDPEKFKNYMDFMKAQYRIEHPGE